jgi:cytochrome c
MSKRTAILFAVLVALSLSAGLSAATRGTSAEAKTMLQKAVGHFKSAGRQQALADFMAGKPPFHDRDLYVVCVDSGHKIAANGGFPAFVGTSADALKDANGKPVGKALWDAASQQAEGSIHYPMLNPVTHKLESKTTFYQKVASDLLCGVGAYNAE